MAIVQHHDAVSNTEKQHIANDYAQRLAVGSAKPVFDGKEKDEDKRDAFDYGFVPFAKPKKEKTEKAKKGKSKSQERLTEERNDSSVPLDAGPLARVACLVQGCF
ncbi:unnamed protein product [Sphagnum compactum]